MHSTFITYIWVIYHPSYDACWKIENYDSILDISFKCINMLKVDFAEFKYSNALHWVTAQQISSRKLIGCQPIKRQIQMELTPEN